MDERRKTLFLELLPADGSLIGNITLRPKFIQQAKQKLNLDLKPEDYLAVKSRLLDEGKVGLGRGKGGSVRRIIATAAITGGPVEETAEQAAEEIATAVKEETIAEAQLYDPFHETVKKYFTQERGIKRFVSQITAFQGKRATGGTWTRPDVTLVAVHFFGLLPGKYLDVTTFEVKPKNEFDIKGVFEAAAHTAFSHRSYLAIHVTEDVADTSPEFERVKRECRRLGIGLLTFNDPKDADTFDFMIEPEFKSPDWADVDNFLRTQLDAELQRQLQDHIK